MVVDGEVDVRLGRGGHGHEAAREPQRLCLDALRGVEVECAPRRHAEILAHEHGAGLARRQAVDLMVQHFGEGGGRRGCSRRAALLYGARGGAVIGQEVVAGGGVGAGGDGVAAVGVGELVGAYGIERYASGRGLGLHQGQVVDVVGGGECVGNASAAVAVDTHVLRRSEAPAAQLRRSDAVESGGRDGYFHPAPPGEHGVRCVGVGGQRRQGDDGAEQAYEESIYSGHCVYGTS